MLLLILYQAPSWRFVECLMGGESQLGRTNRVGVGISSGIIPTRGYLGRWRHRQNVISRPLATLRHAFVGNNDIMKVPANFGGCAARSEDGGEYLLIVCCWYRRWRASRETRRDAANVR